MLMTELLLLEYQSPEGTKEKMHIPLALLRSNPDEVLRRLKAAGVQMAPGAEDLIIQYLSDEAARVRERL
jgi:Domain of unknown function (DUF927)